MRNTPTTKNPATPYNRYRKPKPMIRLTAEEIAKRIQDNIGVFDTGDTDNTVDPLKTSWSQALESRGWK
jgi:hypothetical protein